MSSPTLWPWATLGLGVSLLWCVGVHRRLRRLREAVRPAWALAHTEIHHRAAWLDRWCEALAPWVEHEPMAWRRVKSASEQVLAAAERMQAEPLSVASVTTLRMAEAVLADARAQLLQALPAQRGNPLAQAGWEATEVEEHLRQADTTLAYARAVQRQCGPVSRGPRPSPHPLGRLGPGFGPLGIW